MKKGSHIYIKCVSSGGLSYTHHGIYCGDNKVIHYYNNKIRRTSISKFSGKQKIYVKEYRKCAPASLVVRRAKSRKGEKLYNLIFNNCEHFVYWCKTGKHKSQQVEEAPLKLLYKLDKDFKQEIKNLSKKISKEITRVNVVNISKLRTPKIPKIKPPKIKLPKVKPLKIKFRF